MPRAPWYFLLLCVPATRVALAQEKQGSSTGAYRVTRETPDLRQKQIGFRALTRSEGLAILDSRAGFPRLRGVCFRLLPTSSTESMSVPASLMNMQAPSDLYCGYRRISTSRKSATGRTWPSGWDMLGLWSIPFQHSFFQRAALRSSCGFVRFSILETAGGAPISFVYGQAPFRVALVPPRFGPPSSRSPTSSSGADTSSLLRQPPRSSDPPSSLR